MHGQPLVLPPLEDLIIDISLGIIWAILGLIAFVVFLAVATKKEKE